MGNREMRMPGRHCWSEVRRPLVALGTVCLLMAGCTDTSGDHPVAAAPIPADAPTPTSIPRNPGALAYGVNGDIFVAEWDGSNAVRIADGRPPGDCHGFGEYWGEGPIWSPDGRYLAYRHTDCDKPQFWWDVVISDPEGKVVASFPSEGWLISWSPDSERVATWVRWGKTLAVYGLDGERQAVLTLPPGLMGSGDYDPVWSPDGASLLVPHGVEIPLDGSTPHKLPLADRRLLWLTVSPDGSRVAYIAHGSLVVAAAGGSNSREVLDVAKSWWSPAVWSPRGDRIAFIYGNPHFSELRVIDVATGASMSSAAGMDEMLSAIDFSPDGDRILFSRTDDRRSGVSSLWSVHADGSNLRRLVTRTAWGDWRSPSETR